MRKLIAAFIKYPFYSNIIIVILVVGGTISTMNMKQSFFPETKSRDIIVTVFYPGASPKEMEEGITTRVEEAVRSIVGLKEINSTSSENFSRVTITTTGEYDLDATLQEVKNAVDGISSFPSAAERPIVFKQRNMTGALFMGLAGNGVDMMTLKRYATDIEDDLRTSGIITQVSISGIPNIEISVEISEMNLQRYGLTMDEVSRAVALNNADISAGVIKSSEEEILIRSRHRSVDPNKIGNIVLRANPDGSLVRIRDVANVKLKFEDVPNYTLMNDMQSVFFQVNKLNEEDLKDITKFCIDYAENFNQEHDRVKLYVTFNFLKLLKARLMLLVKNGLIGLLLVLATLGLFLNLRLSFWVAWGIPASFLGMFMVASLMGVTINMITLFAMILVIGILVDDGIVIAENIYAHFEQGKSPQRAALDGTMEVLPAVTTSIVTTVIAFSPLLLVKEGGFEFMFEMAIVVIFSLLMSLLEAFFVLPAHVGKASILSKVKSRDVKRKSFRQKMDGYIDVARNKVYSWLLKRILRWRWVYVFVPVGLLIITIGLIGGGVIKVTPFPSIPFEFFQVNMAFTPGSGEQKTMEYLKRVEDSIWVLNDELMAEQTKLDDEDTIPFITYSFVGVGNAFQGVEIGSHAGNIFVQLRDLEKTGLSSFDIVARLQKKVGRIPEAEKFTIGGGNRFGKAVSLSLLGKNIDELKQAEQYLIAELSKFNELTNILNTNAEGKREVLLDLKSKAYTLGLNHGEVSRQVRQGFFGDQAQRLQQGKDEVRVWIRYPKSGRQNVGQLEDLKIKTRIGEFPLAEIATYRIDRGPVNIKRFNMQREIRVDADMLDALAPVQPVTDKINKDVIPQLEARFPGVNVKQQGQARAGGESLAEFIQLLLMAIAIIAIILMIHFRSFSQALIILMMIPLAWLGAVWGHGMELLPVSLLSLWGMIALSGVIINDAVVFLAKYNLSLQRGLKVPEAIMEAGKSRFRPILLTTLTTTLGLYPLVLEKSFQAQFLQPMAAGLAYGVLFGTIFILIFFPAIIMVLNDIKRALYQLWTGKRPEPENVEKAVLYQNKEIED